MKDQNAPKATGFVVCQSNDGDSVYVLTVLHIRTVLEKHGYSEDITVKGSIWSRHLPKVPLVSVDTDENSDLWLLQFEGKPAQETSPVILGNAIPPPTIIEFWGFSVPTSANPTFRSGEVANSGYIRGHWLLNIPANPGDSGAPVFNESEEVVAVIKGGFHNIDTTGEAIPISFANDLINKIPCKT